MEWQWSVERLSPSRQNGELNDLKVVQYCLGFSAPTVLSLFDFRSISELSGPKGTGTFMEDKKESLHTGLGVSVG
jgi:hypothetical protein